MIKHLALVALCACVLAQSRIDSQADNGIVITEYQSKVDLTVQNPIEKITLTISNRSPNPLKNFLIMVPDDRSVVGGTAEDAYGQMLSFERLKDTTWVDVDGKKRVEFVHYVVTPQQPISPEYSLKLSLTLYFNSFYSFKPRSVNLFDDQKVLVTVYKVPASPYKILQASTDVTYGDRRSTEKYSANQVIPPLSPSSTTLHFPLNIHFVHSKGTTRYIEISHWGNIYFQDQYLLHNRAAKFRGEFSTLDFNKGRKDTGRHAFRSAYVKLPPTAWGLFYRDEIGNITTSSTHRTVAFFHQERCHHC